MTWILYIDIRKYNYSLYFPGNIIEDDDSTAKYDLSSGKFHVRITKETKGEHFPDLDLLNKLLARRGEAPDESNKTKKPLIEVIGGDDDEQEQKGEEMQEGKLKEDEKKQQGYTINKISRT